jgi:hypothetical protein
MTADMTSSMDTTTAATTPASVTAIQQWDTVNDDRDIDALFTKSDVSLLPQPATRRTRQRRTFDMTNVRRSARLAKKQAIPAVEHTQRNLCRTGITYRSMKFVQALICYMLYAKLLKYME